MARKEDARKELARRELDKRRTLGEITTEAEQESGRIGAKAEFIEAAPKPSLPQKALGALPSIGQFVGGLTGGVVGSRVGAPLRGAAVGGVAGRTGAAAIQKNIESGVRALNRLRNTPPNEFLSLLSPKSVNEILQPIESVKAIRGQAFSAAITEAIGGGVVGTGRKVGKGILEATLGKRVAQRGFEVGFKKLLKKENFTGRIPKAVAEKTGQFFERLKDTTGKGVQNAINALQGKERIINTKSIGTEISGIKKLLGSVDDLSPATSNQQKKLIKEIISDVDNFAKKGTADVGDVWKLRRDKVDKVLFGKGFSDEGKEYLFSVRAILNNPIKKASPEVEKHFTRYSFVKQMEKEMEKEFKTRTVDGKIFAKRPEKFAANLLKTAKDEEIAELKQLDSFLGLSDRVIEDLLDVAAAESLDKPFELIGLGGRVLAGALGGKKTIAGAASIPQMKAVSIPTALTGRAIPTMFTDLLTEEQ